MNRIFQLVKVMRKCDKRDQINREDSDSSISSYDILKYVFGAAIAVFAFFMGMKIGGFLSDFSVGMIVQSVFLLVTVIIAFISIPMFINTLFLSSDITSYIVLPYKPSELSIAKLIVVAINCYGLYWIIMFPLILGYGINSGQSVGFWLGCLLLLVCVPMVTLSIVGIIVQLLMRFVPFARNKDTIAIIGVVFSVIIIGAYGFFSVQNSVSNNDHTLEILYGLLKSMGSTAAVVPIIPLSVMIIDASAYYFIPVVLIISAAYLALYMIVSNAFYLKTAIKIGVGSGSGKTLNRNGIKKLSEKRSIVLAYSIKELKTIIRTPTLLLNGFIMPLIYPIILGVAVSVPILSNMNDSGIGAKASGNESIATILVMIAAISSLMTTFTSAFNNSTINSISREGKSFFVMKTIPVSYIDQIRAKRNVSLWICSVGSVVFTFVAAMVLVILMGYPVWTAFYAPALGIPLMFIIVDIEMIFAVSNPNLAWESDAELNKGGALPIFLSLGVALVVTILSVSVFLFSLLFSYIPMFVFAIISVAVAAAFAFCTNKIMYRVCRDKLNNLE